MVPKIRGVAPTSKRFAKSDLGVKTPQKNISKGHKELDVSAQKVQKGEIVEVRLEEQGLYGSWHKAVVCGVKQGLRQVEFHNLFDDDEKPVKEWVRFGIAPPGVKQPLGTRKQTDGKPVLRPGGPGLPPAEPSFRKTGGWPKDLWVEVFADEAWWEGVLGEDISASQMDEEDSVVDVLFPHLENLIEQVALKNLRECKDWNEETGVWSIRGRLGKEKDPRRTMPAGSPASQGALVAGNGRGERKQDEDSSFVEIGCQGTEGPGDETCKPAAPDHLPSATRALSTVKSKDGPIRYFGRLIEVVEEKTRYLVRVQTLQYTLDEIQISVKDGFIALDVTSANIETEVGTFVSKVHNVCCAVLDFPTDADIDFAKISWELCTEVLTFIFPRVEGGKGVNGSP